MFVNRIYLYKIFLKFDLVFTTIGLLLYYDKSNRNIYKCMIQIL